MWHEHDSSLPYLPVKPGASAHAAAVDDVASRRASVAVAEEQAAAAKQGGGLMAGGTIAVEHYENARLLSSLTNESQPRLGTVRQSAALPTYFPRP
jgi:hypothetical protein